jgi:hypothetical protein
VGVALFGLASLLCGMANSIGGLLAARTLQGAGAALIVPQILTTLHVTLKGTAHARAISLYGGIGGIALSSGRWAAAGWCRRISPGWAGATRSLSMSPSVCWCWRLARYVPETRRDAHSAIDWQGTVSLALILCCLLFRWRWVRTSLAVGAALLLVAILPLLSGCG